MAAKVKKNPKSPDYWGEIAINVKDTQNVQIVDGMYIFKLSGWKKVSKAGTTYLSIALDRRERDEQPQPRRKVDPEDVPF
jgi:uncharacterized protein (DUF736 family)